MRLTTAIYMLLGGFTAATTTAYKSNPNDNIASDSSFYDTDQYTIFFHTRNKDKLELAIEKASSYEAPYLSRNEVRELTGLSPDDIAILEDVVYDMGGDVAVSTLADHATIKFNAEDADMSREKVLRALKDKPSLHAQVAHVHKHGVSLSVNDSSAEAKRKEDTSMNSPSKQESRSLEDVEPGVKWDFAYASALSSKLYSNEDQVKYVALQTGPYTFYVLCPNGNIETPSNICTESITLSLTPKYFGSNRPNIPEETDLGNGENLRITFNDLYDETISSDQNIYIYYIPSYLAKANVFYSKLSVQVTTTNGTVLVPSPLTGALDGNFGFINPFNATGESIKNRLHNVPEQFKGKDGLQHTTDGVVGNYYYNTTVLSEYLALSGIDNVTQLEIVEWGGVLTPNECIGDPSCDQSNKENFLDVSALQSMAPKATTQAYPGYLTGGNSTNQMTAWNQYFDDLINEENPGVVSWSWTSNNFPIIMFNEFEETEESPGAAWQKAIDMAEEKLMKVTAMGWSIFVASGDNGASGFGDVCLRADNLGAFGPPSSRMAGMSVGFLMGNGLYAWPAFSPWVTSVGGTQLLVIDEGQDAVEVACSAETSCGTSAGITSAGGFTGSAPNLAIAYSRPQWQEDQVNEYLKNNGPDTFDAFPDEFAFGYNPHGRGFPDLAAYASSFPVLAVETSTPSASTGTSLAAPLTAGLFTLVNEALLEKGYEKVGYANPMLYWIAEKCPDAFNDITFGNNQAPAAEAYYSEEGGENCQYGYPAAPGWDPVTGLGSIIFEPFVSCAIKYQTRKGKKSKSSKSKS